VLQPLYRCVHVPLRHDAELSMSASIQRPEWGGSGQNRLAATPWAGRDLRLA
jgi:hypothetical protein